MSFLQDDIPLTIPNRPLPSTQAGIGFGTATFGWRSGATRCEPAQAPRPAGLCNGICTHRCKQFVCACIHICIHVYNYVYVCVFLDACIQCTYVFAYLHSHTYWPSHLRSMHNEAKTHCSVLHSFGRSLAGFAPLSADLSGSNIIQDPDISQHVAVEGELRESFAALFAAHARHMTKRIKYQGDMRLRQAYLCTVATCNGC